MVEKSDQKTRKRFLGPPFSDAEGEWVPRESFEGKKSFGFFTCRRCRKDWTSAHAFAQFRQQCKACKSDEYPTLLW